MRELKILKLIGLSLPIVALLLACNGDSENKKNKSSQALVDVDGNEITVLQLNEELARSGARADQLESASKQLLESLIARQLIVDEAIRAKLDRTPEVMQARDRANAQIIAQAYLKRVTSKIDKPSKAEIDEYYQSHPQYFEKRKQFDLTIIRIATNDFNNELQKLLDGTRFIDEITTWLDKHNIKYNRIPSLRSTADLPSAMANMMLEKGKNYIFVTQEQGNSLLVSINSIKDSPLNLEFSASQIEKILINQKYKQAIEEEVKRLRSFAKIEYLGNQSSKSLNSNVKDDDADMLSIRSDVGSKAFDNNDDSLHSSDSLPTNRAIERGMMGLK